MSGSLKPQEEKNPLNFSPYKKLMYALNSPESKRQYPKRLQMFLDYIHIKSSSIEESCNVFYEIIKREGGVEYLETQLLNFFAVQNQRAENGEISTETIKNYYKPIKRFCEMNRIIINWNIISKGIMRGSRYSNDRPPTVEEIRKLLLFPDRRIKPIVLVMVSSGMRVGSWAYLKWGHIRPIEENKVIKAAKITIFNTKTKRFYNSLITPEAYEAVKEWMEFRKSFGEKITDDSWVMRNLWQIKSQRYGNYLGLAKHPNKLSVTAIRVIINDAWKIQGLREKKQLLKIEPNQRVYPFKSVHGFRKFFETECQKVMRELIVSTLMSHDTGIVMHYLRPKEEDILVEYQKAIALLTIDSDAILLNKQIQELEDKNQNNEWIIKGKLQEKDEEIKQLKLMHETDIGQIRQEMQNKFHELITKIDLVNIQ